METPESHQADRQGHDRSHSSPPTALNRDQDLTLSKQDRRQPLAAFYGRVVGRTPGFEELHELLARAVVVPLAVAPHDRDQVVDRFRALALAVERDREVEARLVVERIGVDLLLQFVEWAD